MVDNFELIKKYMERDLPNWKEGDCYYLQLLRRASDDPKTNGVPDPKYHGNMHSRSIKDYLIRSTKHLDDVKDEIKFLCEQFNVRAYIRLNKRNYKNIALEMMKHIAQQCASGESFSSPYHLISSACGTTCQAGKDKTWILDLDKEYLPYEEEIKEMVLNCEPYKRMMEETGKTREEVKKEFFVVPTKSGKHIVFLGSSVTYGAASNGVSFVDFLAEKTGCRVTKEAVSGTMLVDDAPDSYICRMRKLNPEMKVDLFVCQLSTNDATKGIPLGSVSEGETPSLVESCRLSHVLSLGGHCHDGKHHGTQANDGLHASFNNVIHC